jgi:hypothetical protein
MAARARFTCASGDRGSSGASKLTSSLRKQRPVTTEDIKMPERMHEVLQKERRARHEYEQRHVRPVEAKGATEQFDEKSCGDQPDRATEREHQPHRHFPGKQRDHRADQRALGEAEMIIDQEVDVGDAGRQRDLVEEHSDQNGGIAASIRRQGSSHSRRFIRHLETTAKSRADYHMVNVWGATR